MRLYYRFLAVRAWSMRWASRIRSDSILSRDVHDQRRGLSDAAPNSLGRRASRWQTSTQDRASLKSASAPKRPKKPARRLNPRNGMNPSGVKGAVSRAGGGGGQDRGTG